MASGRPFFAARHHTVSWGHGLHIGEMERDAISSHKDSSKVSHPDMGADVSLWNAPTPVVRESKLPEEKKIPLFPEEVYIHSLISPDIKMAELSKENIIQDVFDFVAKIGRLDVMKALYECNSKKLRTYKAYMNATSEGHLPIIEWLDSIGACLGYGVLNDAFIVAASKGNIPIMSRFDHRHIINGSARNKALYSAIERKDTPVVEWLLSKGDSLTAFRWNEAFIIAVRNGNIPVMKWLLSKGAFCDIDEALEEAANSGRIPIIEWLVSKIGIYILRRGWNNALVAACRNGNLPMMEWLVSKGAGPEGGWNKALKAAARGGDISIIEWLEAKGADGWDKALECAARCRGISTMKWLKDEDTSLKDMIMANDKVMKWLITKASK